MKFEFIIGVTFYRDPSEQMFFRVQYSTPQEAINSFCLKLSSFDYYVLRDYQIDFVSISCSDWWVSEQFIIDE